MSLKSTKEQLIKLLSDEENNVIALSGKWGTGKSYMWGQVRDASAEEKVKGALYASLFGLSSVDQIKMKLIQSAVPAMDANPGLWDAAKKTMSSGVKVLEGFHQGFGALNDVGLLFAPAVLRQKVIVLDDIERKHSNLDIDEVLGFIDDFTQQHDSRFVLILNSDQLDKRDVWDTLREKVVDQELQLTTSSAEAFEIAIGLRPSIHAERIRVIVEICELTNIRIIQRIIKVVNRVLGDRQGLSDAVLSRVIPSTVLLSAIHYKGIEDGPDFDFVLAHGSSLDWSSFTDKKKDAETEESKRQTKWKLLLNKLGILGCDEFELLIVELLQSGLFDITKVAAIIDRYLAEADQMNAMDSCNKFFEQATWNHNLTEDQLLAQAKEVASKSNLMDAYMVTSLYETIVELPGGQAIADEAVARWIEAFKAKNLKEAEHNNFFQRGIHPLIKAEFDAVNVKAQADTSAFDACLYVARSSGWGTRQEVALKSATVQHMETVIRTSTIQDLRLFMLKMLDLCVHKETYEKHFGSAMDNFAQACRNIVEDPQSRRLGKLVALLFADAKITHLIEAKPQSAPEAHGE